MSRQQLERLFPKLIESNYSITSPKSIDYNCIAWAAGSDSVWWWPDQMGYAFWPTGVPIAETLNAFIAAFESLGYEVCNSDQYEEGVEKVAIFVDSNQKPTHATKQLASGIWSSKLGQLEDIQHFLDGVSGPTPAYGSVAVILRRPKRN
jgi:hypothetical protein